MGAIRESIVKSSVLYSDKHLVDTITESNFVLEYSCVKFKGYSLEVETSKKYGYVVSFGCQRFSLSLLKEIKDNLNDVYRTEQKKYILINGNKELMVKTEDDSKFFVNNGNSYVKENVKEIIKDVNTKKVSKKVDKDYWSGRNLSYYQYKSYNLGNSKPQIIKVIDYCIEILEELEYLTNKN